MPGKKPAASTASSEAKSSVSRGKGKPDAHAHPPRKGPPRDPRQHPGKSRDPRQHPGKSRDPSEHPGKSRDSSERPGKSRDPSQHPGKSRDSSEHPGKSHADLAHRKSQKHLKPPGAGMSKSAENVHGEKRKSKQSKSGARPSISKSATNHSSANDDQSAVLSDQGNEGELLSEVSAPVSEGIQQPILDDTADNEMEQLLMSDYQNPERTHKSPSTEIVITEHFDNPVSSGSQEQITEPSYRSWSEGAKKVESSAGEEDKIAVNNEEEQNALNHNEDIVKKASSVHFRNEETSAKTRLSYKNSESNIPRKVSGTSVGNNPPSRLSRDADDTRETRDYRPFYRSTESRLSRDRAEIRPSRDRSARDTPNCCGLDRPSVNHLNPQQPFSQRAQHDPCGCSFALHEYNKRKRMRELSMDCQGNSNFPQAEDKCIPYHCPCGQQQQSGCRVGNTTCSPDESYMQVLWPDSGCSVSNGCACCNIIAPNHISPPSRHAMSRQTAAQCGNTRPALLLPDKYLMLQRNESAQGGVSTRTTRQSLWDQAQSCFPPDNVRSMSPVVTRIKVIRR